VSLVLRAVGGVAHLAFGRRFRRALIDPARAQQVLQAQILADLQRTELGQGLRRFDDLPPRAWSDLAPFAEAACRGEIGVLSPFPVTHIEHTSGSTGPRKSMPVTAPLQSAVTAMLALWAGDLIGGAKLGSGRTWVVTTPVLGGTPQLPADDTAYLSGWARPVMRRFLVPPDEACDGAAWVEAVAARLVQEPRLEVISGWNPTLLELVLDAAERQAPWTRLWPQLRVVSAWGDAHAAPALNRLSQRLRGVLVQPKGLLATEGPMTVPLIGLQGSVGLVEHVVLELINPTGDLLPLHEARLGEIYELVPSWRGGLVRYRIGDLVEVVGHVGQTPTLRLVGRADARSDLVGEKLDERFVQAAFARVLPDLPFATLVPLLGPPARYALLSDRRVAPERLAALDVALREAVHYDRARELGQLGALEAVTRPDAALFALQSGGAIGSHLGDQKHRFLVRLPADGWLRPSG
jgi:hypothetical protein